MTLLASLKAGAFVTAASFFGLFGGHVHVLPTAPHATTTESANVGARTHASVSIACIASAVATREAAIDTAESSLTGSLNTAYTTRASALASAYGEAATSSVQAAVKTTWSAFDASVKTARQSWKQAQLAAWQLYATAARACGAPASSVSDVANASADAQLRE